LNETVVEEEEGAKILSIPKSLLGQIQLASWQRSEMKRFMPVLLQRKVLRTSGNFNRCIVAIQLRSNLHNKGSLKGLSVVVAIPPTVIGSSLEIKQGEGTFDNLKRVVTWTLKELLVGKSLMYVFEIDILSAVHSDELPKFPILLRCSSAEDTISNVKVNLEQMQRHPATLFVKTHSSFQLLHRLPL